MSAQQKRQALHMDAASLMWASRIFVYSASFDFWLSHMVFFFSGSANAVSQAFTYSAFLARNTAATLRSDVTSTQGATAVQVRRWRLSFLPQKSSSASTVAYSST